MPQPKRGYALGSNPSHHRLMMRNLAESLFVHERIQTTEAKAKALRPYAERLITKAKKGTVHHRRQVLSDIENREVVHKLFADIGSSLCRAQRRVHPHPETRSAERRRCSDGAHRIGRGFVCDHRRTRPSPGGAAGCVVLDGRRTARPPRAGVTEEADETMSAAVESESAEVESTEEPEADSDADATDDAEDAGDSDEDAADEDAEKN